MYQERFGFALLWMHVPSWLTQKAWDTLDLRSKRAQTWTLSLKELATWSLLFSRASASCLVFIFNFQWLLVIFFFVLTGCYHKFGFGLYDVSSKSPNQAIFQCSVWQNSEGDIGSSCFRWESISSLLSNLWQRRRKRNIISNLVLILVIGIELNPVTSTRWSCTEW